jgi:hypothetical protein
MAQLSRPFQIGLAAVALLAVAWLLLLQGHSGAPTSPAPVAPATTHVTDATAPSAATKSKGAAPSKTGSHASAPAAARHAKATAKAHGASSTSKSTAQQLEHKSSPAASVTTKHTTTAATTAPPAAKATPAAKAPTAASTHSSSSATSTTKASAPAKTTTPGSAAKSATGATREHAVEAALARGQIAFILFWNPKGADDVAVHRALVQIRGNRSLHVDVQEASAGEVAAFGTITRGVQVYGTPTLLVLNKSGQVLTLTGVQPASAIEQAIQEARQS